MAGRADAQRRAVSSVQPGLRRLLRVVREIVGAPDYERYLERRVICHPDEAPLSPRQFYREFVNRRFGGGPTRCC